VPNIGPTRYVQAAGFLKIPSGENPLDRTWIHPESYGVAARLLSDLGFGPEALDDKSRQDELREKLKAVNLEETAIKLQAGVPTLHDILDALARPGRDPREDLPAPVFKKGILRIEDLQPGMELKGTVLNVVDFGAFVDVGLKDSGLVHISQMANRYIKNPYEIVAVSDVVTVWVLNVDHQRHRVSLSMINQDRSANRPRNGPSSPAKGKKAATRRATIPPRGGQGRQGDRPQDQRSRRPGGPPQRRGPGPRPGGPPQGAPGAPSDAGNAPQPGKAGPPPRPAPPPRKPRRETPRPKLSQSALEGKTPLRTFAELGALFAAKQAPPPPPPPVVPDTVQPVQALTESAHAEPSAPVETPATGEPIAQPPQS